MPYSVATQRIELDDQVSAGANAAAASLDKLAASAEGVTTSVTKVGPAASTLVSRYDDASRAAVALQRAQDALAAAQQTMATAVLNGTATQQQADAVVDKLTGKVISARTALDATTAATGEQTTAAGKMADAHNIAAHAAGTATVATAGFSRELVVLGHEVITGNFSRIPGSMMVLAERSGNLHAILSGIGSALLGWPGAIGAGVIAIGSLGYAAESQARQLNALQDTLRATKADFVGFADEVTKASKTVAATSGISTPDARAAGTTIAAAPNFGGTQAQLQDLIKVSGDLATVMGKTVPDAAKILAAALQDPGKEADELAKDHFPGMSAELARAIERMANAGDTAGAFNRELAVIKDGVAGANDNLTPLQQSLRNLGNEFTSAGQGGRSLADQIGTAFTDAAASAIQAVANTIQAIKNLQAFASQYAPGTPQEGQPFFGAPALPFGMTVQGIQRFLHPGLPSAAVPGGAMNPALLGQIQDFLQQPGSVGNAPDNFSAAGGVNDALHAAQAAAAIQNQAVDAASSVVKGSKIGQIQDYTDQITRFKAALADLGPRTTDNAAKFDILTNAIKADQKSLEDAQKSTAGHRAEIDKQIDKVNAGVDAQGKLTEAYGKGGAAVMAVTASMKAQEEAISDGLTPGTQKYTEAVAKLTAAHDALAVAQARTKTAEQTAANSDSIDFITAETDSLGMNNDARQVMLDHLKAEQALKRQGLPIEDETSQAYLKSVDALSQATLAYDHQKTALNGIASAFTSAFDQISQGITNSFLQGTGAAVNWGNVMKSVAQQVISEFLKLSLLNPVLNSFFGQTNPTLGGVFSALVGGGSGGGIGLATAAGGLLTGGGGGGGGFVDVGNGGFVGSGGSTAELSQLVAAGGGIGGASGGGMGSLLNTGSNLFSLARAFFPNTFSLSGITNALGISGQGSLLSGFNSTLGGLTSLLNTPLFGGLGAADSSFLSASSVGSGTFFPEAGLLGSGGATIGSLIGGVGAGFGAGSLLGSYIQSGLNKTGPGPTIGAGAGALAGAAIGSIVPGIGTVIGGIIGGLLGGAGGGLIGPRPASPYSGTYVGVNANTGALDVGWTIAQKIDASNERAGAISDVNTVNNILAADKLRVSDIVGVNGPGRATELRPGDLASIQIGQNTPGDSTVHPEKFGSLAAAFPSLRFASSTNDQNFYWGASYRSFANPGELAGVTTSINDFVAALKGTSAESSTTDLLIKSITAVPVANKDVQAALQATATFVTATVPNLLEPLVGSLKQQTDSITNQYKPAIDQANALGYGATSLTGARDALISKAQAQADQQVAASDASVTNRLSAAQATLTGTPADAQAANLASFDTAAGQQVQQLKDQLTGLYGYSYSATTDYTNRIAALNTAIGAERDVLVQQQNQQTYVNAQASYLQNRGLYDRYQTAAAALSGTPGATKAAALEVFDTNADAEKISLQNSLESTYGAAYLATQDYANKLTALERAQGEERLALAKQYDDQITTSANSTIASLNSYAFSLQTSSASPLSPKAQLTLAGTQFDAQAKLAETGDYSAISNLQTYSNAYLNAAHNAYGSGTQYVAAFSKVIDALGAVSANTPDTLTASILKSETRTQTEILVDQLQQLKDEVSSLRLQLAQGTSAPARVIA